jgi:AcrR family transcriptional regulator
MHRDAFRLPGDRSPAVDARSIRAVALNLFAENGYRSTTMAHIGAALGVRGPSLYRHVRSKQDLLAELMTDTMTGLLAGQQAARAEGGEITLQVRRMVESHVRFHATYREHAIVGNREIASLVQPHRDHVVGLRRSYEETFRASILEGAEIGAFAVTNPRLASYAILNAGIGVASWFRPDGLHSADEVAYTYAEYAIGMLTHAPQTWPGNGDPR